MKYFYCKQYAVERIAQNLWRVQISDTETVETNDIAWMQSIDRWLNPLEMKITGASENPKSDYSALEKPARPLRDKAL